MKKRKNFIKKTSLMILLMLSTSCQNRIIYTACPDVVEYTKEFNHNLAEDLKSEKSYFIKQVVVDYYNLREKIKICNND